MTIKEQNLINVITKKMAILDYQIDSVINSDNEADNIALLEWYGEWNALSKIKEIIKDNKALKEYAKSVDVELIEEKKAEK